MEIRFLVPSLRNCVVHPASTCWRTGHALRGFNVAFAARNRIGQGTGMLVRWDGYTIIHSWICWTHHSGYVEPLWATIHRNEFKSTRCFTLLLGFLWDKDMPKKTSCILHLLWSQKTIPGGSSATTRFVDGPFAAFVSFPQATSYIQRRESWIRHSGSSSRTSSQASGNKEKLGCK